MIEVAKRAIGDVRNGIRAESWLQTQYLRVADCQKYGRVTNP